MNVKRKIALLVIFMFMAAPFESSLDASTAALSGVEGQAVSSSQVQKVPKMVLIIRHAEKPPAEAESPNLSPRGVERAKAIPSLFLASGSLSLGRPDVLFATRATRKSNRPIETIVPLSQTLGLPIENRFGRGDVSALVQELSSRKYAGKVVLISWHHAEMKGLATSLGVPDAPAWPETLFDRIWKIDWNSGKAHLISLPQNLLPGDSAQ